MSSVSSLPPFVPEQYFFQDDGEFPNSALPTLVYRQVFSEEHQRYAQVIQQHFSDCHWYGAWVGGVFSYHHYHSIVHEVLGVFSGWLDVQLGGPKGQTVRLHCGDVVVIPAGVAHKQVHAEYPGVVGAYPDGMDHDLIREGEIKKRAQAIINIAKVPRPLADPVLGSDGGILRIWV